MSEGDWQLVHFRRGALLLADLDAGVAFAAILRAWFDMHGEKLPYDCEYGGWER